jgi:hypothetical protein
LREDADVDESTADVHRRIVSEYIDLTQGHGLEIGPLAKPIALRGSSTVEYVDVTDREGLLAHYAHDPSVDPDAVPTIDYWLAVEDGTTTTLGQAVAAGAPFDWVLASHVVEHVPDVVGWLRDVGDVLADDGSVFLVVPDRRFCFDARRSPTTVGMAVQAHELGDRIPSVRAVFDHFRKAVEIRADEAWHGTEVGPERTIHPFSDVLDQLARVRAGEYVDAHVWTFTPLSFIELIDDLGRLGLIDLTIREVVPTARNKLEFYVVLERIPRGTPSVVAEVERQQGIESARARVPSELLTQAHQRLVVEKRLADGELARLREELARTRQRLAEVKAQRDRVRRRLRQARRRLEAPRPRLSGLSRRVGNLLRLRSRGRRTSNRDVR